MVWSCFLVCRDTQTLCSWCKSLDTFAQDSLSVHGTQRYSNIYRDSFLDCLPRIQHTRILRHLCGINMNNLVMLGYHILMYSG